MIGTNVWHESQCQSLSRTLRINVWKSVKKRNATQTHRHERERELNYQIHTEKRIFNVLGVFLCAPNIFHSLGVYGACALRTQVSICWCVIHYQILRYCFYFPFIHWWAICLHKRSEQQNRTAWCCNDKIQFILLENIIFNSINWFSSCFALDHSQNAPAVWLALVLSRVECMATTSCCCCWRETVNFAHKYKRQLSTVDKLW